MLQSKVRDIKPHLYALIKDDERKFFVPVIFYKNLREPYNGTIRLTEKTILIADLDHSKKQYTIIAMVHCSALDNFEYEVHDEDYGPFCESDPSKYLQAALTNTFEARNYIFNNPLSDEEIDEMTYHLYMSIASILLTVRKQNMNIRHVIHALYSIINQTVELLGLQYYYQEIISVVQEIVEQTENEQGIVTVEALESYEPMDDSIVISKPNTNEPDVPLDYSDDDLDFFKGLL